MLFVMFTTLLLDRTLSLKKMMESLVLAALMSSILLAMFLTRESSMNLMVFKMDLFVLAMSLKKIGLRPPELKFKKESKSMLLLKLDSIYSLYARIELIWLKKLSPISKLKFQWRRMLIRLMN